MRTRARSVPIRVGSLLEAPRVARAEACATDAWHKVAQTFVCASKQLDLPIMSRAVTYMAGQSRELPATAIEALKKGRKIEAIKILRQEWGLGLKEAKDAVDAYVAARPAVASQLQEAEEAGKRAKRLWIWLLILMGATVLFFRFFHP